MTLQPLPGDPLELEIIELKAKLIKLERNLRDTEVSYKRNDIGSVSTGEKRKETSGLDEN